MECPGIPVITLGEVGDELLTSLQGRRFPLGGTFELTERCNLDCLHCYINQPAGCREAASRELTLAQVQRVLDQIVAAGTLFLLFTGGEPLLRADFPEIWRYAKSKGLLVSLFTNGTLLTPQIADLLAEWRPVAIEITLYGATAETYERVTGVPGSYARCLRAIELVLERGLRLNLKSVVLRANRHELDAMAALAAQFGVSYRFDGVLWPRSGRRSGSLCAAAVDRGGRRAGPRLSRAAARVRAPVSRTFGAQPIRQRECLQLRRGRAHLSPG